MQSIRALYEDERAIEGLPIRLVIALVVGVAVLGIMMGILGGFDFGGETEVDVEPDKSILEGAEEVTVTVVTPDGDPVEGARVYAKSGTLSLEQPIPNGGMSGSRTGADGNATIEISDDDMNWRNNQEKGTIKFDINLPGDSGMVDNSPNAEITVIRDR